MAFSIASHISYAQVGRVEPVERSVRSRAVAAARGQAPFDCLLVGGTVVDVATGELRPADVGLVGPLIASVHPAGSRRDAVEVVDVSGKYIAPGFMDMHVHFESSMLTPAGYAAAVVPHGTTTIFADPHELANVAGLAGVRYAIDASHGLPMRMIIQAPSCVPSAPGLEVAGADFTGAEMAEMLAWPEVGGVAELMDTAAILNQDPRMVEIVEAGFASGKLISGHAFLVMGPDLQAYVCAGVASDHEQFTADDVIEKLRLGMTVELRYLLEPMLLDLVPKLNALPIIPSLLTLASDDIFAVDLLEQGHINLGLRRLIAAGLDPVQAIRCATLNAAQRLGRSDLGLVGPGRRADLVILSDLAGVVVDDVYFGGQHVASQGRMLAPVVDGPATPPLDTVKVPPLTPEDFVIKLPDFPDGSLTVNTVANPLFTQLGQAVVQIKDGQVEVPSDLLIHAAIHRHGQAPATPFLGLLANWGPWTGAIATTVSHDSHNLQVFGRDTADMALAANTVIRSRGGVAVVKHGEVLAHVALPIAGLLSTEAPEVVAEAQRRLDAAAAEVGLTSFIVAHAIFQTFASSLACLPGPHVTDVGYVDGTTRVRLPFVAEAVPA